MKRALSLIFILAMATPAFAEGDIAEGEKVFKKCQACHMVGEEAKVKTGPVLNNIFGATAGTDADYEGKYSKAMVEAGENGLVWTEETMGEYLLKPKAYIKKTKMAFAGLKKDEDRENIIAYLKQFSPDYAPETN